MSSVGTSQPDKSLKVAIVFGEIFYTFEGTLKDINFVFEYRVDLRPWIAEDHRLIARYDGKVSVKKETVKVEIIKEGSGWVLQLDSELEPMELGSKWRLRNNNSFSQLLPSVASVCSEQVTHREGPVAQGEINLSAKYMNNRLTLEADPYILQA